MRLSSSGILFAFSSIVAIQAAVIKRHNGEDHGASAQSHDILAKSSHSDKYSQNADSMGADGASMIHDTPNVYGSYGDMDPTLGKDVQGDSDTGEKDAGSTYSHDDTPPEKKGKGGKRRSKKCHKSKVSKGPMETDENVDALLSTSNLEGEETENYNSIAISPKDESGIDASYHDQPGEEAHDNGIDDDLANGSQRDKFDETEYNNDTGNDDDYKDNSPENSKVDTHEPSDNANVEPSSSESKEDYGEDESQKSDNDAPKSAESNVDSPQDYPEILQGDGDESSKPFDQGNGDSYGFNDTGSQDQGASGDNGPTVNNTGKSGHMDGDDCKNHDMGPGDKMDQDKTKVSSPHMSQNQGHGASNIAPSKEDSFKDTPISKAEATSPNGSDSAYQNPEKAEAHNPLDNMKGLEGEIPAGSETAPNPQNHEASPNMPLYQTADVNGFGASSSHDYSAY